MLSVMRSLIILLLLFAGRVDAAPLNAVIGDAGWRGTGARTDDDRIAAHLATVEAQLRRASDGYPGPVRAQRLATLDRLASYRQARRFPHNTYVAGRAPVFVDAGGRRCAVGALAEHDLGAAAIERVAARQRLAYLPEISDPVLTRWIATSGFTPRELAMVQPTYKEQEPRIPTREELEQAIVSTALTNARQLCELDMHPSPGLPTLTVTVALATGAITWPATAVAVTPKHRGCIEGYVKRALPAKLRARDVVAQLDGQSAWTSGGTVDWSRTRWYLEKTFQRSLAACKLQRSPSSEGYTVDVEVTSTGAVVLTKPTPGAVQECLTKVMPALKLPAPPAKAWQWDLHIQPRSTEDALAEVGEIWRRLNEDAATAPQRRKEWQERRKRDEELSRKAMQRASSLEGREESLVSMTLAKTRELCEVDLYASSLGVPAGVSLMVELSTATPTWDPKSTMPAAWKTCVATYLKRALPRGLRKRTIAHGYSVVPPPTEGTPRQLHLGRAIGFMKGRLQRVLATCGAKRTSDEEGGYRVEIYLQSNGTVDKSSVGGELPDRASDCVLKEIGSWRFPAGLVKEEQLNLEVQPRSIADELAEVAAWWRANQPK